MELSSNLISRIRIWERGERARRLFLNIILSHRRIKREKERENDLFFSFIFIADAYFSAVNSARECARSQSVSQVKD